MSVVIQSETGTEHSKQTYDADFDVESDADTYEQDTDPLCSYTCLSPSYQI